MSQKWDYFYIESPRNGTFIFGFCLLYLVYVYIGNVESTPVGNMGYVVCADIWYI